MSGPTKRSSTTPQLPNSQIYHQIGIKASQADVYDALTNPDQLARWWLPAELGETSGGRTITFRFGGNGQEMVLSALKPEARVGWTPTPNGLPDWVGSEITFEIAPEAEHTVVRFRHDRLPADMAGLPYFSMSWAVFLLSLKDLLETGKGYPFPNRWIH